MVPSAVYLIQNNLLYVAVWLKILTTAITAVTVLNKKLISTQWRSVETAETATS